MRHSADTYTEPQTPGARIQQNRTSLSVPSFCGPLAEGGGGPQVAWGPPCRQEAPDLVSARTAGPTSARPQAQQSVGISRGRESASQSHCQGPLPLRRRCQDTPPHTFHPPLCRPGSSAKMLTDRQREHSRHSAPQGTLHLFSAPDWTHPGEQGALSPSSVAEAGRKVSSSRWGGYQAPLALTSLVPQVRLGGVATEWVLFAYMRGVANLLA